MKKKFSIVAILACISLFCTGCQLAKPDQSVAGDELVGFYITTEHRYEEEDILLEVLSGESANQKEQGKIYGTFDKETRTLTFPEIMGYPLFHITEYIDDAPQSSIVSEASDLHMAFMDSDTSSEKTAISGTFYYDASKLDANSYFYCNPLYKTPTGEYYFVPQIGEYISGGEFSQSMSYQNTITKGKKKEEVEFEVTAHFKEMVATDKVTFTQMGANGTPIQEDTYTASDIPESYAFLENCEYIFVTITDLQGIIRHDIINKDEEYYSVFFGTDHIFCKEAGIEITY